MVDRLKTKVTTKKAPAAPKQTKIKTGLCKTCKHADHCRFPRLPDRPVSECDEFEGLERRDVIAEKLTSVLLGDVDVLARLYDGDEDDEYEGADVEGTVSPGPGAGGEDGPPTTLNQQKGANMATTNLLVAEVEKTANPEKVTKLLGLCKTCSNAATCTFPREAGRPVRFCDEFDGEEKVEVVKPKVEVKKTTLNDLKGLCRLCDRAESCTFPKAEGGVWHCEEYE